MNTKLLKEFIAMKKIITAINNPELNEELKKEKNVELICKDIQYKEGILEILEMNLEIDYIFINFDLPGQISFDNLLKRIKRINENINILVFIKKDVKKNYNFLENKNIKIIFFENNININLLKNKNDEKKELHYLKNENSKKDNFDNSKNNRINLKNIIKIKNEKNNICSINNVVNNFFELCNKNKKENKFCENKIITVNGTAGVGKTVTIINFSNYIKNNKILIINLNIEKQNLHTFFGVKKFNNYIKNKKVLKNKKSLIKNYKKIKNKFTVKYFSNFILKNLIIKINEKLDILSYNKLINFNRIKILEKNYDYIFIENSEKNLNKRIIQNSYRNIILIEPNLIGLKNANNIINNILKINKENVKIILNKSNTFSINLEIIKKCYPNIKIIGKIEYKKIYDLLINKNYKEKNLLDDKKIINENKIIFNNL
jgi:hypothetical protein